MRPSISCRKHARLESGGHLTPSPTTGPQIAVARSYHRESLRSWRAFHNRMISGPKYQSRAVAHKATAAMARSQFNVMPRYGLNRFTKADQRWRRNSLRARLSFAM